MQIGHMIPIFQSYISQAYHTHMAGHFSQSFDMNIFIGEVATKLGEFDVAEKAFSMATESAINKIILRKNGC